MSLDLDNKCGYCDRALTSNWARKCHKEGMQLLRKGIFKCK